MFRLLLTEAAIAGGETRTTPTSLLRDSWIKASDELHIGIVHDEMAEYSELLKVIRYLVGFLVNVIPRGKQAVHTHERENNQPG
ncbi:hypothetical protein JHK84_035631 [Glycine max]|nr:hypothetical protein JHK86_035349 [Glycine max]KAG5129234.1 hypothetical protein JHK84_035631 [Glycine max]